MGRFIGVAFEIFFFFPPWPDTEKEDEGGKGGEYPGWLGEFMHIGSLQSGGNCRGRKSFI